MNFLRLLNPKLYDAIQVYKPISDLLMPWAYQTANPQGRPLHDDWGIMSKNPILRWLQPWQRVRRIDTAYRVPLPFRISRGAKTQQWMPWDVAYPLAPGTRIEDRVIYTDTPAGMVTMPHALIDVAGQGLVEFEAYIGGAWTPVFRHYQRSTWFGRRIAWYWGLKPDVTVAFFPNGRPKSDLMCWFPEISISWIKE